VTQTVDPLPHNKFEEKGSIIQGKDKRAAGAPPLSPRREKEGVKRKST